MIPPELMPKPPPKGPPGKPTGVAVRVLRSAPIKLQQQEAKALRTDAKCIAEQCEIQTQMVNVITNATDFVYIENQFFQSEFGNPSVDSFGRDAERTMSPALRYVMSKKVNAIEAGVSTANHLPSERLLPANKICEALGRRIESAVRRGETFHVYMVLPVHPEGRLDDPLVIGQVHWTMQSLVFADHSLINRIRRAIKAKEICTNTLNNGRWEEAMKAAGSIPPGIQQPLFSSVVPEQWGKYLTLLNLRNCQVINGKARTEQIYVHSKLLIADDRHVVLGSANINDRSQSGKRDSEISVILFDSQTEKKTVRDLVVNVNPLARNLRVRLWEKHLAFSGSTGIVKSAAGVMASLIDRPAAQATIDAIQGLALNNSTLYRKTFPFIPWSNGSSGASLWPVCPPGTVTSAVERLSESMPFGRKFWGQPAKSAPAGIIGFFTSFPINWTIGENNHPLHFNAMALTMDDSGDQLGQGGKASA